MVPARRPSFLAPHGVALLLAAALFSSLAFTWHRVHERTTEVRRLQAFTRHLGRLHVASSALVSAERGYVLTGDEEQMEAAEEAIGALDDALRTLESLTRSAVGRERLAALGARVEQLIAAVRSTVEARSGSGAAAASQLVQDLAGLERRGLESEIRFLADDLDAYAAHLASLARLEREQHLRTLFLLAVAAAIALAAVLPTAIHAGRGARTATQRLAQIAGSGVVGIAYWDSGGRLIESNAEYDRIVGMPREAGAQPVYWTEVFAGDDSRLADAAARHVLATGACQPFFASCRGSAGVRIPVLSWSIRLATEPVQYASFVVDLSRQLPLDRRALEHGFTMLAAAASGTAPASPTAPLAASAVI